MLKKKGFSPECVEMNRESIKKLKNLGFKIHDKEIHQLKKKNNYDIIFSFQVLEHIPNPKNFIKDIIKLLKPGGKLVFAVPNSKVIRKIDPCNETLLNNPPHHMGHWDKDVFEACTKFFPLKIKAFYYEPLASYHVKWFVINYLRNFLSPIGKILSKIIINSYSTLPLQLLLKLGLRKYFKGHTLLVEFEYIKSK